MAHTSAPPPPRLRRHHSSRASPTADTVHALGGIDAASSRAAYGTRAGVLVINAVLQVPRRAWHDGQLTARSMMIVRLHCARGVSRGSTAVSYDAAVTYRHWRDAVVLLVIV